MKKQVLYLLAMISLLACKERVQPVLVDGKETRVVKVEIADTLFVHVEDFLEMERYVILSQAIPLANIERIIVSNDRIFILDREPKIVCYNFEGKAEYQIASKGGGPKEYASIADFAVNPARNQLTLYDSSKRKLRNYDLFTGKYLSDTDIRIAPNEMAIHDNIYYFNNPYNFNYPDTKALWYSLLWAFEEGNVDGKFFPHDGIISEYHFGGSDEHPFYYNGNILYYNKMFDEIVYKLEAGKIEPAYCIKLPNPVPLKLIEEKIDPLTMIESPYSSCLEDIYQCDSVLYFSFNYEKFFTVAFYDLEKDKTIYCGKRIVNTPIKSLLAYYPIRGMYNNCFFSVVPPATILEKIKENPDCFPDDLKKITDIDNPVVMFYKVRK